MGINLMFAFGHQAMAGEQVDRWRSTGGMIR